MQRVFDFLKNLSANNSKDWMDKNRSSYQEAKDVWLANIDTLLKRLAKHDPQLIHIKPKSTIMRINNNRRFHPDKPIYRSHFAFSPSGNEGPGFYVHISPGGSFIAGGIHRPDNDTLKKIRAAIDYDGEKLKEIITRDSFVSFFGGLEEDDQLLKTSPRGYSNDHPYIELLKRKNFIAIKAITQEEVISELFADKVEEAFIELAPLNSYLTKAIEFK